MDSINKIQNSIKYWYIPFVIGLLFVFIGGYCLFSPYDSYLMLAKVTGYAIILSGLIEIFVTFQKIKENGNWQWSLIFGLSELAIGFIIVNRPEISVVVLSIFVAYMVFIRSINAISNALELKTLGVKDWWMALILGLLGIVLSYILIDNPKLAGNTVAFWIGIGLIISGIVSIYISFKFKNLKKMTNKIPSELKDKWDAINNEIQTRLKQ